MRIFLEREKERGRGEGGREEGGEEGEGGRRGREEREGGEGGRRGEEMEGGEEGRREREGEGGREGGGEEEEEGKVNINRGSSTLHTYLQVCIIVVKTSCISLAVVSKDLLYQTTGTFLAVYMYPN